MPDRDPRLSLVHAWLDDVLPGLFAAQGWGDVPPAKLLPASSDASFRRYFRWQSAQRTLIIMDAPPPQEDCRPFVKVAGMLAAGGAHVPQILAADLQQGFEVVGHAAQESVLGGSEDDGHAGFTSHQGGSGYHARPFRLPSRCPAARAANAG